MKEERMKLFNVMTVWVVLFLTTQLQAIVGTTKGEFSVNQGVAEYSLKIDVPPGVAGMEPELSLNYSSSGGNGYMGVGWSMGGVSAITRCAQSKAVDGTNHKFGVKYNSDDRFCLDGQRLINIRGKYGESGTEYKTEIDTYSKITSKSKYKDGPSWFEVKTKSGLIYQYGLYAQNSYNTANGRKTFWKISRIFDTFGNKIEFKHKRGSGGELYLDTVTYGGNTVQYSYENRVDKMQGYHAGTLNSITKRLKEVIVKTGSTEVRRYKMTYTNESSGSKRSKLTSITERAGSEDLKTLRMTYQSTTGKLSMSTRGLKTKTKDAHYIDFNGDGFVDVYSNNNIAFGDGKGGFSAWKSTGTNVKNDEIKFADFDGDGDVDFIIKTHNTGGDTKEILENELGKKIKKFEFFPPGYYMPSPCFGVTFTDNKSMLVPIGIIHGVFVYKNNGKGVFIQDSKILSYVSKIKDIKLADFNGDGKIDIYDNKVIYLNKGNDNYSKSKTLNINANKDDIFIQDLNGDGLADIYEVHSGRDYIHINDGSLNFRKSNGPNIRANYYDLKFADLNGDGAVDIYEVDDGAENIWINNGKGNFSLKFHPNIKANTSDLKLVDLNGDGYPDIYDVDDGKDNIWLNNGQGNFVKSYELAVYCGQENLHFTDINGDGLIDMLEADKTNRIWFNKAKIPLITKITNNTDQDIRITYKNMTDKAVYHNYSQNGKRNAYSFNKIANDNIEITSARPLVHTVKSDNGVGGFNNIRYKYYGYVINRLRGNQGFHAIYTYDDTQRMLSGTFYKQIDGKNGQNFQYTGMPYLSFSGRKYGAAWGKWASRSDITYKDVIKFKGVDGKRTAIHQPYTSENRTISYDVNNNKEISRNYHNNYLSSDGLGNIVKTRDKTVDKTTGKTFYKYSYNYYNEENENDWIIGRLTSAKVVHKASGASAITKSSSFEYDSDTGVLIKEVANSGTTQALTKSYEYDSHGNKIKETISGSGVSSRSTTFGYSSDGKFQTSVTNAIGLRETRTYDARFGTLTSLTGPNELTTTWKYDSLGRKIEEKRADGTKTSWAHVWGHNYIGARNVLYSVAVSTSGKPFTRTYYDKLGREVGAYTYTMNKGNRTGYSARRIQTHKYYDAKGQLYASTMPHYGTDSKPYIRTYFDAYGRAIKETKPGPQNSTQTFRTSYNGFTTITTDPKGHRKYMQKDANGKVVKVVDAYGSSVASQITYKYDASGNLVETRDSKGNKITMVYDALGNKKSMNDPDLGRWYYSYNALGQLIAQSDANGARTTIRYDKLGRVYQKYVLKSGWKNYNYYYNSYYGASASKGSRGKLRYAYSSSKTNYKDWHGERKYSYYDSLGRTSRILNHIYGKGDYNVYSSYDKYSRPTTTTYPSGYKVTNHYKDGILEYVKGSDGKVHYKIDELTALGQVKKARYANGVVTNNYYDRAGYMSSVVSGNGYASGTIQRINYKYDSLGNVVNRDDYSIQGKYLKETYKYDAMNRLTRFDVKTDIKIGSFRKAKTYKYDQLGNMTYQTGVGTYKYSSIRPHAVVSTSNKQIYKYDANGNMTYNRGRNIVYNPINKATYLTNKKGQKVSFYYGVGGQRYMKT
ncbi:MAG TPA: hypothetical protein EYG74_01265, partial [Sulfurimonas autotrophica]|nr:hypothetical protein [Sulfurimonas autotrophica]